MFIICVGLSGKFILFLLFCYVFDILIFSHKHHFSMFNVLFSQTLEKQWVIFHCWYTAISHVYYSYALLMSNNSCASLKIYII